MNRLARAVAFGIMCSLVTNHISAVAPQDEKVGRLKAEWRLVKKGINATIKGLKGRTLTQDERASRISLAKQVGILLGLIAVASGVYVISKKIRTTFPQEPEKKEGEIEKKEEVPTKTEALLPMPEKTTQEELFEAIKKEWSVKKEERDVKKINDLLAQVVDPNTVTIPAIEWYQSPRYKRPLLHWVIAYQDKFNITLDIVKALIAKANLETKDSWSGETPLHYAVKYNNKEVVETLLKAGASLEAKDYDGRTPLGLAKYFNEQFPGFYKKPGTYSKMIELLEKAEQTAAQK